MNLVSIKTLSAIVLALLVATISQAQNAETVLNGKEKVGEMPYPAVQDGLDELILLNCSTGSDGSEMCCPKSFNQSMQMCSKASKNEPDFVMDCFRLKIKNKVSLSKSCTRAVKLRDEALDMISAISHVNQKLNEICEATASAHRSVTGQIEKLSADYNQLEITPELTAKKSQADDKDHALILPEVLLKNLKAQYNRSMRIQEKEMDNICHQPSGPSLGQPAKRPVVF